jgi:hypothetical protein
MEYGRIDWAGAKKCSAGYAIEQKLNISVSKIVGGSGSVIRGNRDKPEYVKQSAYSAQIDNARNIFVLLFDVGTRRGWLMDGASALLHMVRTQIVHKPYGTSSIFNDNNFNRWRFNHPAINGGPNAATAVLKEEHNMKHIILREFDSYADETNDVPGLETLSTVSEGPTNESGSTTRSRERKEIHKTTCLKELVSQTWSTLEQIYDRQIEVSTTHSAKHLQNPLSITLEGYEFMSIVSANHILTRRVINLQSNGKAWNPLVKHIHAITLFGQHFGDIYKPTEISRRLICENWKAVPQGHDYLAIPISLLKDIKQHSWEEGEIEKESTQIAKGIFWSPSEHVFNYCKSDCRHTHNRVQQLQFRKPRRILNKILGKEDPSKVDSVVEINGAVLFGQNSVLEINS